MWVFVCMILINIFWFTVCMAVNKAWFNRIKELIEKN